MQDYRDAACPVNGVKSRSTIPAAWEVDRRSLSKARPFLQSLKILPHVAVQLIYIRIVPPIAHGHRLTNAEPPVNVDRAGKPGRAAGFPGVISISERKPTIKEQLPVAARDAHGDNLSLDLRPLAIEQQRNVIIEVAEHNLFSRASYRFGLVGADSSTVWSRSISSQLTLLASPSTPQAIARYDLPSPARPE